MRQDNSGATPAAKAGDAHERRLLACVADGDRRAFDQLYFLYHPKLTRFLSRMLGLDAGADALVNEVMFIVWTRAGTFAARSRVSTWVFGIAYHVALKALRKRKLRDRLFLGDRAIDRHAAPDAFGLDEQHQWLRRGLETLSARQRAVVELAYFGGYDYKEIAAIVDCPVGTVKTRMFSARRKLKAALGELEGRARAPANSGGRSA